MGKKRLRDMTWDDYGISKNRYKELKAFCLQYDEKQRCIRRGIRNLQYADRYAARNAVYSRDCGMIREAAVKADSVIWKSILKSVTRDLKYELVEYDGESGKIPICRCDFYGTRRLFYSILDKIQLEHKSRVPL